jgi:hypothetical protein
MVKAVAKLTSAEHPLLPGQQELYLDGEVLLLRMSTLD